MNPRIYITPDPFPALAAFLQKGVSQDMKFFIYDTLNLIQNRLWTFSSTTFLPNVTAADPITKIHNVPIIISTTNQDPPPNYICIMFEFQHVPNFNGIAFVKQKNEALALQTFTNTSEMFEKTPSGWQKID